MRQFIAATFVIALSVLSAQAESGKAPSMIAIIESEGKLVHLDRAAATMFVADPHIASLQVVSNSTVFILAHVEGRTTLYALDEKDDILFEREIVVHKSLEHLQQDIRSELGN